MPVVVKRVANEPVLIATLSGFVTVDDIITMYEETAKHFANYDGHIYRITDTRGVDSSFSDLMMILAEARKKEGFTTNSGKVTAIIVGENEWARMTREAMRQQQYGGLDLPGFATTEEALDYVRAELVPSKSK
ncbi:MAG: hypothetical protein KC547_14235 [Anaerolineae bacterium]|nr:hypothetical protein [Anaerolineae bacterium]